MMGQLSSKFRLQSDGRGGRLLMWYCQGCDEPHAVSLDGPMRPGEANCGPWAWNGDAQAPTFSPSVNVRPGGRKAPGEPGRCHTFITNGTVQFLADCEHALAGQTLPMADLPDWLQDEPPEIPEVRHG
jgi:hypothetical protein